MKNIPTRLLSVALVFLMLFTMMPLKAFAEDEYTAEAESDVDFELNNALNSAINDVYGEQLEFQKNTPCYINDIELEGNTATVDLFAIYKVNLIVAVYTEDGAKMITSAKATVEANSNTATVTFDKQLPDYFLLKAFMLGDDYAPLSDAFTSIKYTKAYQDFEKKETTDFDSAKVINLDENIDNNFVVVADEAKVIKKASGKNTVTKKDMDNGVYVFENATTEIKNLKTGDVFYYVYGQGESDYILTKVGSVKNVNGTVTVTTAEDCEFTDLFSYIKIDIDPANPEATVSEAADEKGETKEQFSHTEEVAYAQEFGGCSLSLNGSANFILDFDFLYDKSWVNLFEDFEYELLLVLTSTFTLNAEFEATYEREIRDINLVNVTIPLLSGMGISIRVNLSIAFKAKFTATGTLTLTLVSGAKIQSGMAPENRSQPPRFTYVFDGEGEVELTITPELQIGINFLWILEVAAGVSADVIIHAEIEFFNVTNEEEEFPEEKHECEKCIEGDIKLNINLRVSLRLNVTKKGKELLGWTFPIHSGKLCDFYISLEKNGSGLYSIKEWDLTTCPHKLYRVYLWTDSGCDHPFHIVLISGREEFFVVYKGRVFYKNADGNQVLEFLAGLPGFEFLDTFKSEPLYLKEGVYTFTAECIHVSSSGDVVLNVGHSVNYIDKATEVKANYGPILGGGATASDEDVTTTEKALSTGKQLTTTVSNATAGNNYVVAALKTIQTEDLLAPENLLYIDQQKATGKTLKFEYLIDKDAQAYEVVYFSAEGYGGEYTECEHSFTNYLSDKNATYTSDGTKTAFCDKGCGARDTVTDVGSKLKLAKVRTITATQTTSTITLNWSKSEGATGYRVYQYSPSKGKYVVIASIKGKTSYTKSKNLKAGSQYKFKIKPYIKLSDGTVIWGSASDAFTTATKPLAPTKVTATTTKSTITLNWSASAGATGYRVYQYSPSKGKYVVIESLKGKTSYKKSKNLKAGTTYKFKIKPYVKLSDGTVIWGSASSAFAFKTKTK